MRRCCRGVASISTAEPETPAPDDEEAFAEHLAALLPLAHSGGPLRPLARETLLAHGAAVAPRHTAPVLAGHREPTWVLVHSPLVGPTTWLPAADELHRRGRVAVVPSLLGVADAPAPRWRHIPDTVRVATSHLQGSIVLVGHSGAGPLLPVIANALTVEVAALVFVDSILPPSAGRVPLGPPAFMEQLRELASDGVLAPWWTWFGEDAMSELVPDERLRAALEAEMPRLPLSYFEANVPVPDAWNRRPCGYLLLTTDPHGQSAAEARSHGWPVLEIQGVGHLAIATDAILVTDALLDLERELERSARPGHRG